MGVPGGGPNAQLQVANPSHSEIELGPTVRIYSAGLPDAGVGGQQVLICLDKRFHPGTADLLFPLDQELYAGRMPAGHLFHRIDGGQPRYDVALVIRNPPGVHLAVPDARLERRCVPQVQRLRRLNVVVVVEDDRAVGGPGGSA